jgi:hypothetical protein
MLIVYDKLLSDAIDWIVVLTFLFESFLHLPVRITV